MLLFLPYPEQDKRRQQEQALLCSLKNERSHREEDQSCSAVEPWLFYTYKNDFKLVTETPAFFQDQIHILCHVQYKELRTTEKTSELAEYELMQRTGWKHLKYWCTSAKNSTYLNNYTLAFYDHSVAAAYDFHGCEISWFEN